MRVDRSQPSFVTGSTKRLRLSLSCGPSPPCAEAPAGPPDAVKPADVRRSEGPAYPRRGRPLGQLLATCVTVPRPRFAQSSPPVGCGRIHVRRSVRTGGFTVVELLMALVIIGVLSALALPSMGRDRKNKQAGAFANEIAKEFQRARLVAVNERLAQRVFIFRDRIETRSAVPGARPGQAPRTPLITDAPARTTLASSAVSVFNVAASAVSPTFLHLDTVTYREIEFNTRGQAQLVGQPAMTPAFLYLSNTEVPASHPDSRYRLDLLPLTGRAVVREGWN